MVRKGNKIRYCPRCKKNTEFSEDSFLGGMLDEEWTCQRCKIYYTYNIDRPAIKKR